ncbi:hypothetical protein PybrP1_004707 [[Pythium] brassicae (nom. inval.)]|nr:hypothetical protein PybrP1_004707 [[Pythium] brassicae (nom. inval.)]
MRLDLLAASVPPAFFPSSRPTHECCAALRSVNEREKKGGARRRLCGTTSTSVRSVTDRQEAEPLIPTHSSSYIDSYMLVVSLASTEAIHSLPWYSIDGYSAAASSSSRVSGCVILRVLMGSGGPVAAATKRVPSATLLAPRRPFPWCTLLRSHDRRAEAHRVGPPALDALQHHERGTPKQHGPDEPEHGEEQHLAQPRAVLPALGVELRLAVDLDCAAVGRPRVLEPAENDRRRHIAKQVDHERVGGDRHRPARLGEELHDGDRLGGRERAEKEKAEREEAEERELRARECHHDEREHLGDDRKVKERRDRHVAAQVLGHKRALEQPVDEDAAERRADRAREHDDAAKHERDLRFGREEPEPDEDHGAEHAQRRERERVRRVAKDHERERRVAEDRPPLGAERLGARALEERRLVVRGVVALGLLWGLGVVVVDVAERRADRDGREEDTHVERAARRRRVRVDERRGVALERRLADAREHAPEEQHVVALRVLGDAAHDDREDPDGHAERDRAERPVREREVAEDHRADRVARDERGREDAEVERLLRHLDVERVRDKVLELLGRARDDAAVDVVEQVDRAEQHDGALRAQLRRHGSSGGSCAGGGRKQRRSQLVRVVRGESRNGAGRQQSRSRRWWARGGHRSCCCCCGGPTLLQISCTTPDVERRVRPYLFFQLTLSHLLPLNREGEKMAQKCTKNGADTTTTTKDDDDECALSLSLSLSLARPR